MTAPIVLLVNPAAGRGRAARAAQAVHGALTAAVERYGATLIHGDVSGVAMAGDMIESLTLADGRQVPHVNHYKYLGADVLDPMRDFSTRKALAWKTLTGLKPVWMSTAADSTKRKLFNATVRSVFHYGAVIWGRTQAERDRIDGSMTRMLKYALGQTGNFTLSLTDIYGKTPQATAVISAARLRLVGHALRHREDTPQPLQHLLLWDPPLRQRSTRLTTYSTNRH